MAVHLPTNTTRLESPASTLSTEPIESQEPMLVTEYMEGGDVENYMFLCLGSVIAPCSYSMLRGTCGLQEKPGRAGTPALALP